VKTTAVSVRDGTGMRRPGFRPHSYLNISVRHDT